MKLKLIWKTPDNQNHFCGYYDNTPVSPSGKYVFTLSVKDIIGMPSIGDLVKVNVFDIETSRLMLSLKVSLYNWQQGNRLKWINYKGCEALLFNDIVNAKYGSRIVNLEGETLQEFSTSFYDFHDDAGFGLCIDHHRYQHFRPSYSYVGVDAGDPSDLAGDESGIDVQSLDDPHLQRLVSIADLKKIRPLESMKGAVHYVEHIMISPDASKFCFLHRWRIADGGIYARLFTYSLQTSELDLLADTGRIGHFNWCGNDKLIVYGGLPTVANTIRKKYGWAKKALKFLLPAYHALTKPTSRFAKSLSGDTYFMVDTSTREKVKITGEISTEDGHPSSFPFAGTNLLVTDTYASKAGNSEESFADLVIFDFGKNEITYQMKIPSTTSLNNTGWRCDLHPKVDPEKGLISIDTVRDGTRAVEVYQYEP